MYDGVLYGNFGKRYPPEISNRVQKFILIFFVFTYNFAKAAYEPASFFIQYCQELAVQRPSAFL